MHITQCLHTSIHYIGILVSSNPIQKIAAATIWYSILLLLLFFVLFQVLCFQNFQFQTKGVIGQPAEAALVTLKIKPATSDDLEAKLQLGPSCSWGQAAGYQPRPQAGG